MFETFIIQPIFNLLLAIYAYVPGHDFGVAVIVFTLIVRFALWPLVKKQLHQTRALRAIQPEIKKIRASTNGDKQKEAQLLMELYKERGVSPFGSIGILLVQLPILIVLFSALRSLASPERIINLPYDFVRDSDQVSVMLNTVADKTNAAASLVTDFGGNDKLQQLLQSGVDAETLHSLSKPELVTLYESILTKGGDSLVQGPFFDQNFLGIIDLSRTALDAGAVYWPLMVVAIMAGALQYFQSKQLMPDQDDAKSLRDIFKQEAAGNKSDQQDINAAMGRNMRYIFPFLTAFFAATFPGALALYWTAGSAVAVTQQRAVLRQDVEEMQDVSIEDPEKKSKKKKPSTTTKKTTQKKKESGTKKNKKKG